LSLRRGPALAALGWAGLLLFVGSRPGEDLPAPLLFPGADKGAHALAYGVLGALVARAAAPRGGARSLVLGALAGLFWGMLDEWVQGHVPGRTRSWADLLADVAGAACGGFLGRSRPRGPSATMPGSRGEPS
jgi:VanZ family protein